MTKRIAETSPRLKARLAGVLYLLTSLVAFDEFSVLGRLVVHDDPAATAANILAHQLLFRLGFAAQIVAQVLNIFLAVIFFDLFRVVSRSFARLVVFLMLTGTAIETVALLNRFAPMIILHGGNYLSAFNAEQLQGAAYASLQLYEFGFTTALVFFGFYCLSLGYLVFKSAFLPHIIGVLLAIGELAYLTGNFCQFPLTGICGPAVPLLSGLPRPWGRIANIVAPHHGRERPTMERASQHCRRRVIAFGTTETAKPSTPSRTRLERTIVDAIRR